MRQIYNNLSLYLTLVLWNISDGGEPVHHGESNIGPPKVGHWSQSSGGCFPTIIYDNIMRNIYNNIGFYLTLVLWNISDGDDPEYHGETTRRPTIGRTLVPQQWWMFPDNDLRLYHETNIHNISLYLTLVLWNIYPMLMSLNTLVRQPGNPQ